MTDTPAETAAIAANEAAKVVKIAADEAKKVVDKAAEHAVDIVDKEHHQEVKLGRILSDALRDVFGEHEDAHRFVDVTRIPLICRSILDMHSQLTRIEDSESESRKDHEVRLRVIEKNMWKFFGLLMVVPPIVTIIVAVIISLVVKFFQR